MASITYGTPEGGGFEAQVSGAPSFGSFGAGQWGNFDWIADLARRSAKNKLAKQELELTAMNRAMREAQLQQMKGGPRPTPTFVTPSSIGASGTFYNSWAPGSPTSPVNAPIASGFVPAGYPTPKLPENAGFAGPALDEMDLVSRATDENWWAQNSPQGAQSRAQSFLGGIPNPNDFLSDYLRRYGKNPGGA